MNYFSRLTRFLFQYFERQSLFGQVPGSRGSLGYQE